MSETVTVAVPDGVYEGQMFTMEYNGQSLEVVCPDGCGPGDEINLTVDAPAGCAPKSVVIVVPDGCYAGDEFTVEFEGASFNIAVPDGVGPGQEITVEVPASAPSGIVVTDAMFDAAFTKASRMGNKPDADILRWALNAYCDSNGDIEATFRTLGDNPAEALKKPTFCDTPEKFASNYLLGYFKVRGIAVTEAMYDEAVVKASRMGNKPDEMVLRMALNAYCESNGNIEATFRALGDNPAEALNKPTYCDTPSKFAANYCLGYFKVRM